MIEWGKDADRDHMAEKDSRKSWGFLDWALVVLACAAVWAFLSLFR